MDLKTLTPVFLGYQAKKVLYEAEWLKCEAVAEICSVSDCFSSAPEGWIEKWTHNDAGFYETVDRAVNVIEEGQRQEYRIFAFRELPIRFSSGEADMDWNPATRFSSPRDEPGISSWTFLGYDLVGQSYCDFFECSPLSCNSMAREHPVNRHCLMDELKSAFCVGREFSKEESGVEPADYFIVEVFEKPEL